MHDIDYIIPLHHYSVQKKKKKKSSVLHPYMRYVSTNTPRGLEGVIT